MTLPFIPGYPPNVPRLFGRFLPPMAEGVVAHYVQKYTRRGDLIFDPFGQSPAVVLEALSLERRVLVAGSNPVSRLALSLAVRPPTIAQLRSVLTVLGDTPMGPRPGDRLEVHVRNLYRTRCADCEVEITADAFEWDSEAGLPVRKFYVCPSCGGPRESPVDEADRALARKYGRGGLDYHFLLDRVAPLDDADRNHAEEALSVYTPRALAAIGAVLHKFDALNVDDESRRLLAGMLAAGFDTATLLGQERPRSLTVPRRFTEVNFWLALERSLGLLAGLEAPNRSVTLDQLLNSRDTPGIYAHAGTLRELVARLPPAACSMLITAIPRPSQAYWTLSAVWSAWLWGRESAEALRAALRRRRYDWGWHARALQRTLLTVRPTLGWRARAVGLVGEAEPGFTAAVYAAAAGAGLALEGAVLRADTAEAQWVWQSRPAATEAAPADGPANALARVVRAAAIECLRKRAEPSRWGSVHFAAWQGLARQRLLPLQPEDPIAPISRALDPIWQDSAVFVRLGATGDSELGTGLWYLSENELAGQEASLPLADRVELAVLEQLATGVPVDEDDLQHAVCASLPGVETPGRGLVLACLSSYAQQVEARLWQLRPEDETGARAQDLDTVLAELRALAGRHGYEISGTNPQIWRETGQDMFFFAALTSGQVARYLLRPWQQARRRFLVLPGGRAGLVEYKLRRDPRLRDAMRDWSVVKFRHVRRMVQDATLTRATLERALAGDPLQGAQQLALPT